MRTLLYIPTAMVLIVAVAGGVCLAARWTSSLPEMLVAAAVCMIGAEAGLVPAVCVRKSNQVTLAQAALAGTVIEMFLTLVLAALVCLVSLVPHRQQFMFWILGFYWMSLIVMVVALSKLVRQARQG